MSIPLNEIYCPFYEVEVSVWSEMIEKMGTFPVFLLTALANPENTINKIIEATNLNPSTVMETIDDLIRNNLLVRYSKTAYSLTRLGESYLQVNNYLESFPKEHNKIAVNAYTGTVETIFNEKYYSLTNSPNAKATLPRKINKLLIKNHNFSNIKEYMSDKMKSSKLTISNDDYSYIVFDLKPKQLFYVPYIITEKSLFQKEENVDHQIRVIVPIQEVKHRVSHVEIENHKEIIKQLSDIAFVDEDLLSDKGKYIISILNKVKEQQCRSEYYECYSGIKLLGKPISSDYAVNDNLPTFELKARKSKKCEQQHKDGFIVKPEFKNMDMACIISFDDLIQKE